MAKGSFGGGPGKGGPKIGEVSQRDLLPLLKELIDQANAKGAGASRDLARRQLRDTLTTTNWQTAHILTNIGVKRARYLASIGKPVPWQYLGADEADLERVKAYSEGRR
jgi:hypothetical protein